MTNEIKALEKREDDLEKQLQQVKDLLYKARCEAAGIAEGDVVEGRKGQLYKVSSISSFYPNSKPWLHGFKKLKDAGWHSKAHYIGTQWKKLDNATSTNGAKK